MLSFKRLKISYAITVKDELNEIQNLISFLLDCIGQDDEIVVLWDDNGSEKVWSYLMKMSPKFNGGNVVGATFNNDFSDWKNKLNSLCTGNYIFNIDADELPSPHLIELLPGILNENPSLDLLLIPRINTVEGLTSEHIKRWGWNVNKNNWINYPDCQMRIYRNSPHIKWVNKVHEKLEGFKTYNTIVEDYYALIHHKTIERQENQNKFYEKIGSNTSLN